MADLAEEVARFYGYDNIPMTLPSGAQRPVDYLRNYSTKIWFVK